MSRDPNPGDSRAGETIALPAHVDPLLARGIELFDAGEYFDAHEIWETVWTSNFEKALIQAAVALLHATRGNGHGARKLHAGFEAYVEAYRPAWWGIDVDALRSEMRSTLAPILATTDTRVAPLELPLAPRIRPAPANPPISP